MSCFEERLRLEQHTRESMGGGGRGGEGVQEV